MTRKEEIEEKASNYMRGRAMALSFKPLSLVDIKEAYLCGAEDYANVSEPVNPWHKASEELPEEDDVYYVAGTGFYDKANWCKGEWRNFPAPITHWMEIPELPKEEK